jgi:hypothetical protein
MFKDYITQTEIADLYELSLGTIRRLASGKNFAPVENQIGSTKFYLRSTVRHYFANRIDRRCKPKK